eukprot:6190995-Pleurochrysis_carterae.AAC.1
MPISASACFLAPARVVYCIMHTFLRSCTAGARLERRAHWWEQHHRAAGTISALISTMIVRPCLAALQLVCATVIWFVSELAVAVGEIASVCLSVFLSAWLAGCLVRGRERWRQSQRFAVTKVHRDTGMSVQQETCKQGDMHAHRLTDRQTPRESERVGERKGEEGRKERAGSARKIEKERERDR